MNMNYHCSNKRIKSNVWLTPLTQNRIYHHWPFLILSLAFLGGFANMAVGPTYQMVSYIKNLNFFIWWSGMNKKFIKIVELDAIYNFVVDNVFIWDLLKAQIFILRYGILIFFFKWPSTLIWSIPKLYLSMWSISMLFTTFLSEII